jgi:hypothetical protein
MRWVGHVACKGEKISACRVLVGKPAGRRHVGHALKDTWVIPTKCKWLVFNFCDWLEGMLLQISQKIIFLEVTFIYNNSKFVCFQEFLSAAVMFSNTH